MTKRFQQLILITCILMAGALLQQTFAHCEIPCGIYGDRTRANLLSEHFDTVEKSMKQVEALSADPSKNANQLARWVVNKEEHANKIQEIVYQYFMNQRIKPAEKVDGAAYDKYITEITLLHKMLVYSMKCKQTIDTAHVDTLRTLLKDFEASYFGHEKHSH